MHLGISSLMLSESVYLIIMRSTGLFAATEHGRQQLAWSREIPDLELSS